MSKKATLEFEGNKYDFDVISGTENEHGIDIATLRQRTKLVTFDPGFKNTGSCYSEITYLDGENGILRYRGYSIEDLANKSSFLEVCYLLIFGKLPSQMEFDKFYDDMKEHFVVDEEMKKIIDGFPRSAHPMGVLASVTNALIAFNPSAVNVSSESEMYNTIIRLLAKFPVLVAWTLRKKLGLPLDYGNDRLTYEENIAMMMFKRPGHEYQKNDVIVSVLNKLLILHADHEQNCSTSTVRIVGSSHAGLFASISAGIAALWGPLHGGANQAVIEMLQAIYEDGGDTKKYMTRAKDKEDPFRLMGFGHRVYKNFDPRAKIIKKAADSILQQLQIENPVMAIAKDLEKEALEDPYFVERSLYPNVDFYSGIIYSALGIPKDMFTVMFALGRFPGWIAQWKEMRQRREPIGRPRQIYIGETKRSYVEIKDR
ncbi:citrate synthase [Elysia marginata]|uniref:Citrate synthase n=1 Tax=Elysia marginata TaxID=1093978 RepID=A0AAV4GWL0_9GAST|nr:citrate synthase [Elysia marginata]